MEETDGNLARGVAVATAINLTLIADRYFDTDLDKLADAVENGLRSANANGITTITSRILGLRFFPADQTLQPERGDIFYCPPSQLLDTIIAELAAWKEGDSLCERAT